MGSGMSSAIEDKVDSMLQHLATYHGVCSCCGAHEIRMEDEDGKWASWPCECGWFMVAPNKNTWS